MLSIVTNVNHDQIYQQLAGAELGTAQPQLVLITYYTHTSRFKPNLNFSKMVLKIYFLGFGHFKT